MGIFQSTSTRVPVHLMLAGAHVTGMLPANILNGSAQIIKADGTKGLVALTNGVNWFEMDATQSAGIYQFLLPAGSANVLGPIQYTIYPSAGAFDSFVGATEVVLDINSNITAIKTKTDNLPATPANEATSTAIKAKTDLINTNVVATQADVTAARDSIKGPQGINISAIAGGMAFNSVTDNLDALRLAIAAIVVPPNSSPWDELRSAHIGSGSFGEAIRILYQAARGHIKIDKLSNTLTVYQEDGTTILYSCPLLRNSIPANIYADERLQG